VAGAPEAQSGLQVFGVEEEGKDGADGQ